jgi:choline dehydrogenase
VGTVVSRAVYDVAVVGGGSAGCIVASRLSEEPARSVVLIEAGAYFPDEGQMPRLLREALPGHSAVRPDLIWRFVGRPAAGGREVDVIGGRVMGGGSAINGQVFLRGVPEDYDAWRDAGNAGWGYAEVLPYFCRVENDLDYRGEFHGSEGPIPVRREPMERWWADQAAFVEACVALGFPYSMDLNHPGSTGVGATPYSNAAGVRVSSAMGYLREARLRPNLTVMASRQATQIVMKRGRVVGVEVVHETRKVLVEAREVVLSAGAIGSTMLLFESGVGPARSLEKLGLRVEHDLPGVGQNLRDHPAMTVKWNGQPGVAASPRPRSQVSLRYTSTVAGVRNDMKIQLNAFGGMGSSKSELEGKGAGNPALVAQLELAAGSGSIDFVPSERGLTPRLEFHMLEEDTDRRRMREAIDVCDEIAAQSDLRTLLGKRLDPMMRAPRSAMARDRWMLARVAHSSHMSGVCKMAPPSDPQAVVDECGRVYGVKGLRVVDASIMPDCVRANIMATVMMMAERISGLMATRGSGGGG